MTTALTPAWSTNVPTDNSPELRFSPKAWAKLLFLRDIGLTEIGGFGISDPKDLLYVVDVVMVKQSCTVAYVDFDDDAVDQFQDQQLAAGLKFGQFDRIWIHTHPGSSPHPSTVDEDTFKKSFGIKEWSVMFILARGGKSYARLQYRVGPPTSQEIPVRVDYSRPFGSSEEAVWKEEYTKCVIDLDALARAKRAEAAKNFQNKSVAPKGAKRAVSKPWPSHDRELDEYRRTWEEYSNAHTVHRMGMPDYLPAAYRDVDLGDDDRTIAGADEDDVEVAHLKYITLDDLASLRDTYGTRITDDELLTIFDEYGYDMDLEEVTSVIQDILDEEDSVLASQMDDLALEVEFERKFFEEEKYDRG